MPVSIKEITDCIDVFRHPKLQVVTISNWKVLCNKNNFKLGDKVVYVNIDSWIPLNTKYANILTNYLFTLPNGVKGYWIRPIKLAGIISSGLVLPVTMLDIQVENYNKSNLYPYIQDTKVNFNTKYNISKYISDTEYETIENSVQLDISVNRLIVDGIKYADCYNAEDSKCRGILFTSTCNKYNFLIPSMTFYLQNDPKDSGDWEPVELDSDLNEPLEQASNDVTVMDNSDIQTTDGNIDTN